MCWYVSLYKHLFTHMIILKKKKKTICERDSLQLLGKVKRVKLTFLKYNEWWKITFSNHFLFFNLKSLLLIILLCLCFFPLQFLILYCLMAFPINRTGTIWTLCVAWCSCLRLSSWHLWGMALLLSTFPASSGPCRIWPRISVNIYGLIWR